MKIGDLCTYAPKSSIKAGDAIIDGRYMFFTSSSDENKRYSDYQLDCEGIIMGTGGNATLHYYNGKFATSTDCVVLLSNETIRCKYLYYFFLSNMDILESGFKGAGLKHTNKNYINSINISSVPSFEMQDRVIKVLDKVQSIIDKRQQQLEKLDELVKSRFVEMFGDCDLTAQKKEWKTVREVGTVFGGSTPKRSVAGYWNGEYRWLSPAELEQDSGIIFDSVKKITKAGVESCSLQELPVGTVILSSRAPIGKLAIAGNTFYCNQGFKNIVCSERVVPQYLYSLLLFNTEYLNSLGRGATFKEISKSIVENIKIPVPPIELQEQFAAFVEQTDKSKLEIQKSLEKLEVLKKALMQKYFG